jgi:hypothetical protein
MASTKLIVRVLKARGHGVHGLFPHEEAWVEVWVASDTTTSNTVETQKRKGHPLVWNEEYELDIAVGQAEHGQGQGQAAVHVKFRGKMAGHEAIDDIGEGVCGIEEVCDRRSLNLSLV